MYVRKKQSTINLNIHMCMCVCLCEKRRNNLLACFRFVLFAFLSFCNIFRRSVFCCCCLAVCPRRFSFLFPFLECCDSYNTVWKRERMWQHFIAALLFCIARTTHYAYTYKRAGTHTIIRRHTYTHRHTHTIVALLFYLPCRDLNDFVIRAFIIF